MPSTYSPTFLERFLHYVTIDTQSNPASATTPSTEKQKDLARILVQDLLDIGIIDAHIDEFGYVYATIPSNTSKHDVPVICFCSHIDTSPDSSGKGVRPIIHKNYQGNDLVLPDDPAVVLKVSDHPDLADQIGNDIITASGTTLLGADNKAGLAEIMDAAHYFTIHPEAKHGKIRILFTPDEEIGRGVDKVDMEKLGADFGYTVDGEKVGSLEDETFSADAAIIDVTGVSAHPGFAKGKMESALKIASQIVAALPKESLSPETTEDRGGFVHPVSLNGMVETAQIQLILRDFTTEKLKGHAALLDRTIKQVMREFPHSKATLTIKEQYRNMKEVLDKHPQVVAYAEEAIKLAGLTPRRASIRGGTDGSRLSFMGLPCPNIFAGEHAFHSKQEWVSVQDMEKAVHTIINLAMVWERKA